MDTTWDLCDANTYIWRLYLALVFSTISASAGFTMAACMTSEWAIVSGSTQIIHLSKTKTKVIIIKRQKNLYNKLLLNL